MFTICTLTHADKMNNKRRGGFQNQRYIGTISSLGRTLGLRTNFLVPCVSFYSFFSLSFYSLEQEEKRLE